MKNAIENVTAGAGEITHKNFCCQRRDSHLEVSEKGKDLGMSADQSFTMKLLAVKQPRKKQGKKSQEKSSEAPAKALPVNAGKY